MKIIIIGSSGMLGSLAYDYFSDFYDVGIFNLKYNINNRIDYISELKKKNFDVILNCAGKVKQKSTSLNELMPVNCLLPMDISNIHNRNFLFFHPSTDCVFSGKKKSKYNKENNHDATDNYGLTKSLSEKLIKKTKKNIIIRTSIIGVTQKNTSSGILDWFLRKKSKKNINGYKNHFWNGITTLEWCHLVHKIIEKKITINNSNILQVANPSVLSKYDLLKLFNEIYRTKKNIKSYNHDIDINRSLQSDIVLSSISKQLINLKNFQKAKDY